MERQTEEALGEALTNALLEARKAQKLDPVLPSNHDKITVHTQRSLAWSNVAIMIRGMVNQ